MSLTTLEKTDKLSFCLKKNIQTHKFYPSSKNLDNKYDNILWLNTPVMLKYINQWWNNMKYCTFEINKVSISWN